MPSGRAHGKRERSIARRVVVVVVESAGTAFVLLQTGRAESRLEGAGAAAEALPHLRRAVELAPESASAHNDLGVMLAQQNQLDEAIGHFRQAIRLAPDFAEANRTVSHDAVLLQEAIRLAPGNPELQRRLQAARTAR